MVNRLAEFVEREQKKLEKELNRSVTQAEIAIRAEINPSTLSRYMTGKVDSVNWEVWKKLAVYFKVDGHELFDIDISDEKELVQ